MTTPSRSLGELARAVEDQPALDTVADTIAPIAATLATSKVGGLLRGEPLGHAAHPLLTDLPLGCFMSATLVDLLGGRKGAKAATRLVGIGLLSIPVTAATGLVDWHHERDDPRVRRVGAVHAVGNLAAGMLYLSSYRQRRAGHRLRGMALTIAGSLVSSGAGYLGGHMAFAYGAGDGERLPDDAAIRMEPERSRTSTRHSEPPSDTIVHPPADPVADQMQIAAGRS